MGKSCAWRWLDHWTAPPLGVLIQARSLYVRNSSFPRLFAHGHLRGAYIGEGSSSAAEGRVRTACHVTVFAQIRHLVQSPGRVLLACSSCGCCCSLALADGRQHLLFEHAGNLHCQLIGACIALESINIVNARNRVEPYILSPSIKLGPAWAYFDRVPWASDIDVRCELI